LNRIAQLIYFFSPKWNNFFPQLKCQCAQMKTPPNFVHKEFQICIYYFFFEFYVRFCQIFERNKLVCLSTNPQTNSNSFKNGLTHKIMFKEKTLRDWPFNVFWEGVFSPPRARFVFQ
jgi:hypothetical protein